MKKSTLARGMPYLSLLLLVQVLWCSPAFAGESYVDERKLRLHMDGAELGDFNYGHLMTCLALARFDDDSGPRAINRKIKRLIVTTIRGKKWFLKVREEIGYVVLEDITIGTQRYTTEQDKSRHLLHILGHCQLPAS